MYRCTAARTRVQVDQNYLATIYVDDLPIYGRIGANVKDQGPSIFVNHK